jgi:NADH dehydrogenase/NADH:ubiquinone oxidoreductase subunit G
VSTPTPGTSITVQTVEGRTILQVAREHGVHIPTLCFHEGLAPYGACRLCMVEIVRGQSRQLVASCTHPCTDGLVVLTDTPAVQRSRRITAELLLATARHVPAIRELAAQLGAGEPRFTLPEDACILCGLCVRACAEIVGVRVISLVNRGAEKRVSPPFRIASNDCIRCGTCVLVCPTGALTLADFAGPPPTRHRSESQFEAPACRLCGQAWDGPLTGMADSQQAVQVQTGSRAR